MHKWRDVYSKHDLENTVNEEKLMEAVESFSYGKI